MSDSEDRPRWIQSRRYEFIEWKMFWEGQLNRSDLESAFDISTPQASVDLKNYREIAGANLEYDSTEKGYLPSGTFAPRFLTLSADRILIQLRAFLSGALPRKDLWFKNVPVADAVPDIVRSVEPECLRKILKAIRERQALDIHYQSLTSSRWRAIAPHALAFDGHRWHVRAWCCEKEDFRDYVLARIDDHGDMRAADFHPSDDVEWNTHLALRLQPHPELDAEQKKAIERDYGMSGGYQQVSIRASLAYYFIKRLNLDLTDLKPARAQIQLANLDEVLAAIQQAKDQTSTLVASRKAKAT